jgi:hypothetical protein
MDCDQVCQRQDTLGSLGHEAWCAGLLRVEETEKTYTLSHTCVLSVTHAHIILCITSLSPRTTFISGSSETMNCNLSVSL